MHIVSTVEIPDVISAEMAVATGVSDDINIEGRNGIEESQNGGGTRKRIFSVSFQVSFSCEYLSGTG